MKLKELDWNAPGGVASIEVEYPDAPIKEFMDWLRQTPAWRENPPLVEHRLRRLNATLADILNDRNLVAAATLGGGPTPDLMLVGASTAPTPPDDDGIV